MGLSVKTRDKADWHTILNFIFNVLLVIQDRKGCNYGCI